MNFNISKGKWKVVAIAFGLLAVLYIANLMLGSAVPTAGAQKQENAPGSGRVTYSSATVRKLPCGRIKRNTVELENGLGVKHVQLIDTDGKTVLHEKKFAIDGDQCSAIQGGHFVPDLWKGCQCPCDCPMCKGGQ